MSSDDSKGNHPSTSPKSLRFGLPSVGVSLAALLVVAGVGAIALFGQTHRTSPVLSAILSVICLLLPGTGVGLAITGAIWGFEAIGEPGKERVLGAIGLLVSLATLACCLLSALLWVAYVVMFSNL